MLDSDFPFSRVLLPVRANDLSIQFYITVEIPLFCGSLDIIVDRWPARVEARPVWIRIKREGLPIGSDA